MSFLCLSVFPSVCSFLPQQLGSGVTSNIAVIMAVDQPLLVTRWNVTAEQDIIYIPMEKNVCVSNNTFC